jgi:ABC-2 type transport system permease protein
MTTLVTTLQPGAVMPMRRLLRAYAIEVKYEALRVLRMPGMSVPFLLLPAPMYLFFGVVLSGPAVADAPALGNYLFSGWLVFAAMMPALFGAGCTLAIERDGRLLTLKRALPAPAGVWLIAKTLVAMLFTAIAVASVIAAARLTGTTTLSMGQAAVMALVVVIGAIPFCALGLFIGAHVSGAAAPAVGNLVFLPMLWLSGLFFPLPGALERLVVIWPAFHLNQVALGLAGVTEFSYVPPQWSAAALAGLTVLFGGLAIRRLARKG